VAEASSTSTHLENSVANAVAIAIAVAIAGAFDIAVAAAVAGAVAIAVPLEHHRVPRRIYAPLVGARSGYRRGVPPVHGWYFWP
jgi:hypothetical protein